MQKYELALKNEKVKQYRLFALFIIVLNVAFLAVLAVTKDEIRYASTGLVLLIISLFILQYFFKKRNREFSAKAASALLIIGAYMAFSFWWPAVIVFVLAMLYVVSVRRLTVIVNTKYIIYPSFFRKAIEWNELNNVILKDGLLTIDFKNNKIIQQLTEEKEQAVNEKEFNEFCRRQLVG